MQLFRLLLFALGAAVVVLAALSLFTGQRRFLRWSWRVLLSMLAAGLAFFAVLLLERLS